MISNGMTDLHQHVLWGMDDGPETPEAMYKMLDEAVTEGISLIAATPHAYPLMQPFDISLYRQRLSEANSYCKTNALPLRVVDGCEIHFCDAVPDLLRAGRLLTLGGSRYVLLEFSNHASFEQIERAADCLFCAGYRPIIAHVERIRCLIRSPERAKQLRNECSLLFQVNCSPVIHPRGWVQRRFLRRLLEAHAIDLIASDAHDTAFRPICMKEAYMQLSEAYGSDYAELLVGRGWQLLNCKDTG